MSQVHRLPGALPREFTAPWVDRLRPIKFRLDEMTLDAFEGDTVLSALLANGISQAGRWRGHAITLDAHSAPNIALAGRQKDPGCAIPMAMCPVSDGAHFVTLGDKPPVTPAFKLVRRLAGRAKSLGLDLGQDNGAREPWADRPVQKNLAAQVAIVGAGVAGLSAALEAARHVARVIVIEREPHPGGMSVYFGKTEGEPAPDDLIATLLAQISKTPNVTLLTGTAAFALSGTRVQAIQVVAANGPTCDRIDIDADCVILATGAVERLPVFAGNRLPSVSLASFAWHMAARYNVWPGRSAHIHTGSNAGYRMALLGSEAGVAVKRVSDPRYNPQTRFIEFCKAYGFRLGWGLAIDAAERSDARGRNLVLHHRDSQTGRFVPEGLSAERLIVSGGWQPDLRLWMRGGGAVHWERGQLKPRGALDGVEIAGSAAGYQSLDGCAASGAAAARRAVQGTAEHPGEHLIDEMFETPDTSLPVSAPRNRGLDPAFLSPWGGSALPEPGRKGWKSLFLKDANTASVRVAAQDQLEVAGLVAAGMLTAGAVTRYCAERCITPVTLLPRPAEMTPELIHAASGVPDYLQGRFGARQKLWTLEPGIGRVLDTGCLIFANTDETNPLSAIGVVIGFNGAGAVEIVLGNTGLGQGDTVYVRDGLTCTPARLMNT